MKITKILILSVLFILLFTSPIFAQDSKTYKGKIISEKTISEEVFGESIELKQFTVKVDFDNETKDIEIAQPSSPELHSTNFGVGDKVVISETTVNGEVSYVITDYQRTTPFFILLAIFIILVLLVARWNGFFSLLGLAISYFIIFNVLLNLILDGQNALLSAIITCILIIPLNFYLGHGINSKTTYAAVSTIITLILVGVLSIWFVNMAKLTGYTSDEAGYIVFLTKGLVNLKDLLLASILIGTLGILDDITISQSSIAHQLKAAKESISFNELFVRTMAVGRDHISSLVNTLILVYTSASLPLLLLFENTETSFIDTLNREVIMEEIVIMLLSSIGLILAVPISTFISCYFVNRRGIPKNYNPHEGHVH